MVTLASSPPNRGLVCSVAAPLMPVWFAPFLLTLTGFVLGALPFSVWLGKRYLHTDIRTLGDHNPGAANVLRAGGHGIAAAALLLDMLKGTLPVVAAYRGFGYDSIWLVPVALAPVLGHAFSPFLRGQGGKAVAVTGGVWMGLTLWEGPTVGGLALLGFSILIKADGRAVIPAMTVMLLYLTMTPPAWNPLWLRPPVPILAGIGLGNAVVLLWKHRTDFWRLSSPFSTAREP